MPHLVRFLFGHALVGIAAAVLFVGALIGLDIAHLGSLIGHSPVGVIATVVLTLALGITFGSVQMGIAVMRLGEDANERSGGPRLPVRLAPARIPVRARSHRLMQD